jgi:hypothetical protein
MINRHAGEAPAAVTVARDTLTRYVGAYEIQKPDYLTPAVISLAGDSLFLDVDGTGPQLLVPMSQTNFSYSGNVVQFVADGQDAITHFLIKTVEGEDRADRKK